VISRALAIAATVFVTLPVATAQSLPALPAAAPASQAPEREVLTQLTPESLVKLDDNGRVAPLREPVTWAALRRTPAITAKDWEKVVPALRARRAECETIVLRDLDIVESVEGGALSRVQGDMRQALKTITELTRPLRPEGGDFCIKLGKEGVISIDQAKAAQRIASEYNAAVAEEVKQAAARSGAGTEQTQLSVIRRLRLLPIDETIWCYRALVDEAARSLDRALPAVRWPDDKAPDIKADLAAVSASGKDAGPKLMRELLAKLTPPQRRALLTAVIDTREKK